MFGLMSSSGRPTSAGTTFRMLRALGVKRRMRRSRSRMTIGMSTVASRFTRSLLTWRDLLVAAVQLVVDGGQLLVGRLQLFLRRLQLLVHALQLFVARDQLLVGRAEIVVGPPVLLDAATAGTPWSRPARARAWESRRSSVRVGVRRSRLASGFAPALGGGRLFEQHDEEGLLHLRVAREREHHEVARPA